MERDNKARRVCAGLFLAYAMVMVYLLFLQRTPQPLPLKLYIELSTNLTPFKTIRQQIRLLEGGALVRFAFVNLVGNVVMFVPLGFFIPCAVRGARTFIRSMLYSMLTITSVEVIQLVTLLGSLDVDDLLLNLIGAAIGYCGYKIFARFIEGRESRQ